MSQTAPPEVVELLAEVRMRSRMENGTWAEDLGVKGWLQEVIRLRRVCTDAGFRWEEAVGRAQLLKINGRKRVFLSGAPVVQIVGPQTHNLTLPVHLLPALVVNLGASDEVIRDEFERMFCMARERYPPPYRRTGPKTSTDMLNWPTTFRRWGNLRLIELGELIAWRGDSRERRLKYPDATLGRWLNLNKNQIAYAKTVLRVATSTETFAMLMADAKYGREGKEPDRGYEHVNFYRDRNLAADLALAAKWVAANQSAD